MTRILIADDNEQNLYMLQVLLTGYGYQVVSTDNGAKALEIARRDPPDMIVSDILMPVMDGFALCREWKTDDRLKTIPFVFYTATYTDPKDEEFALGLGAERFVIKPAEPEVLMGILQGIIAEYEAGQLALAHEPVDNNEVYLRQYSQVLVRKLEAKIAQLGASNRALQLEIDERIRAEEALHKVNKAYRTLSGCNQVVIRAQSEPALFQAICQTIVEAGGYRLAWVGLAEQDEAKTVRPMAYAGHKADYLDTAIITWADTELGRGPTGMAIRTGKPVVARYIATDPGYEPWREQALERGYESSIALPLIIGDQIIGTLSVYAEEPDAFDQRELDLLAELAGDLAFGIQTLRTRDERERVRAALAQERNLLRTLIDNLPDLIYVKDTEGRFVIKNESDALNMGARSTHEVVGKTDFDYYPQELAERLHADDQQIIQSGQPLINREEPNIDSKGNPHWFLSTKVPLRDDQGKVIGLVGIGRDITERKQAENAERDQRVLAEAMRDTAAALISAVDLDTVMSTILENVARVVPHDAANIMLIEGDQARVVYWRGYQPECIPFLHEFRLSVTQTPNLRHMLDTQSPSRVSHTDHDSGWVRQPQTEWVKSYIAAPIRSHGNVIGFLDMDSGTPGHFTEDHAHRLQSFADQASVAIEHAQLYEEIHRHATELEQRVEERTEQLNYAKERIEAILNSSNDVMILCRMDGTIEQVNPAFEKTFKVEADDVHRQPLTILMVHEHTATLEQSFAAVIATQQSQRLEITVGYKELVVFDADVVLSPLVEQNGHLLGVICSLRDITQRKQMEAQLRQMLAHEIELSELKSRYVSMAAHDLRNPLAVIQNAVEIIRRYSDRLTDEQRLAEYDHIRINIKVMVEMLDDILTLGQVESGKLTFNPAPLDVVAFCQTITTTAKQASGTTQIIEFSSQGDGSTAPLDAKLLRHILGNLLSNAIKYSPEESIVTFTADCEPDQIIFRIQDHGIGIPVDEQKYLFETFRRASNARHVPGTGLGLVIVKQSVELHGGTITFESEEGHGTTFTAVIPQIPSEKSTTPR